MTISLIAALDLEMAIGRQGKLPWRLPADLRHFKHATMGKPLVMGRTTHESIGKPLPGRTNIVMTRQADYEAPGCRVVHSLDEALEAAAEESPAEVMIGGGAAVYELALPRSDRMYLTVIYERFGGDTFFPDFAPDEWRVASVDHREPDEANRWPYSFWTLDRTADKPLTARSRTEPGHIPEMLQRGE